MEDDEKEWQQEVLSPSLTHLLIDPLGCLVVPQEQVGDTQLVLGPSVVWEMKCQSL